MRGGPEVVVFDGSGNTFGARELKDVESSYKEHEPTICFLFFDAALAGEETSYTIEIAGLNTRAHMHEERAEENWLVT